MRLMTLVAVLVGLPLAAVAPAAAQAWSPVSSGTSEILEGVWFTNVLNGWIVGDNGTSRFTTDGGDTWTAAVLTAGDLGDVAFRAAPAVGLIVGDNGTVFRSVNGGLFGPVASGTTANLLNVAFGGPGLAYASGRDGTILRSGDDGASWSVAETGATRYRGASASGSSSWHVGDGGVVRATTNGGLTWFDQTSGTTNDLRGVHFVSPAEGWIGGSNSTVLYTNNGGGTWTPRNTGINVGINAIFFADSGQGWAVGDLGAVFATVNGGLSWVPEASATMQSLNDVFFVDASWGWAAGDAGALIVRDAVTGAPDVSGRARSELLANAPNPFGPSTRIHYSLAGDHVVRVTLTVHDVTGRRIRTLVDAVQPAGVHAATWDGRDDAGVAAAGGVYFYRLRSDGGSRTGRMVLVR
jgi:photosystem II stability/assembly factor-like uncharacterized protein